MDKIKIYQYSPVPEGQECEIYKYELKDKKNKSRRTETITYLSKKQMRRYKHRHEQVNLEKCTPDIQGYLKLKKSKNINAQTHGAPALVKIPKTRLTVHYEATPFHKIKGYIFTTEKNVFLAIEKIMIFPFVLLLLLILLLGASIFVPKNDTVPSAPWNPNIDNGIFNETTTEEINRSGSIKISGFTAWSIPKNQKEDLSIRLINPEGNPCYFVFEMILTETNETIYSSKMIPPGSQLTSIDLNRSLPSGTYPAKVIVHTYEPETGTPMNTGEIVFTINVS